MISFFGNIKRNPLVGLGVVGTKTFIKWGESPYADQPDFVTNISGKEGPYNHSQITTILSGTDWTKPQEE